MKTSKKVAALGLALATGLWLFSSAFVLVPVAGAQTTSSSNVQSQITALMAQINALKGSLGTTGGSSSSSYNFTRNLTVGSKGADVGALQQILINGGYLTVVSAPTNYFGAATKAALAAWQKANGISPAVGYFGPLTMAALAAATSTTTSSTTTTTTTTGGTTSTVTTPVAGGLTVSVASDSPAAGNLAIGGVNQDLLNLNFTAGSQAVTVNTVKVQRSGLSQDSDFQNVYLYNGATRVAVNNSISSGVITFSNSSGLFTVTAGQTLELEVTADIYNSSSNASNVIVLSLPAAANVVTASGVTVGGTFPITGNPMQLVAVSNLASLTFNNISSAATTINAGQTNNLVGQFTLAAGNNPVKVSSIRLTMTGTVPTQYIQNIKLMAGSVQEGATISSLNGNVAQISLAAAPLMLASGQTQTLSLYADVLGGVGDTFQFTVQQSSDIQAVDQMYNVGIGATQQGQSAGVFTVQNLYSVSIAAGELVINSASSTSGLYVVQNNSNSNIGTYTVLASGDNIRLQTLNLTLNGNATVTNVQVLINGTQLGTTQTSVTAGASSTVSIGNLNYIIPANTTQTLQIQGTVSTAGSIGTTVAVTGQSQSNYATTGTVTQTSPTLQVLANTTNLTAYQNSSFGQPVLMAGATDEVASFVLEAGQVNSVLLSGINIAIPSTITSGWMSNLSMTVNGAAFGTAQGQVDPGSNYTFSVSSPLVIAANGSVTVNVYASFSNSAQTGVATTFANLNTVNATAGNNAVAIVGVTGQTATVSQGQLLSSITLDASSPATTVMGMGTTADTLAAFRLSAPTAGPVTVTQLTVLDAQTVAATTSAPTANLNGFNNFTLVDTGNNNNVLNAQPSLATTGSATGTVTFVFSNPVTIAQNGYDVLDLVGNSATFNNASTSEQTTDSFHAISYAANETTGSVSTSTGVSASGNLITLYRTMPSAISAATIAPITSSIGVGNIDGAFSVGAQSGGDVYLQGLTVSDGNSSVVSSATTSITFALYDSANPSVALTTSSVAIGTGTTTATFYFKGDSGTGDAGNVGWDIPASSLHTLQFKVVSGSGTNSAQNNNGTFQLSISKVLWGDGSTGDLTTLPSTITLPIGSQLMTTLSN